MIKNKLFTGLFAMLLLTSQLNGQTEITDFMKMNVKDAEVLIKAYMQPYGDMMGRALNGGWYNVASVHKFPGFDINIGLNLAMVASSSKSFNVESLLPQLSDGWSLKNPNNYESPTIAGKMGNRPVLSKNNVNVPLPDGYGWGIMPLPMLQAGVGLPFNTEIIGRLLPKIPVGSFGKVNLWGLGLKHDLKESLPIIKHLPVLQTSLLVGYTRMGISSDLKYKEIEGDHKLVSNNSGFTGRLIVGANLPVISLYMGLGYGHSSCGFDLVGNYIVGGEELNDPVKIRYKNNNFDANIGMRLKFGVVTIHGDYTLGEYSMISAGLGVSIR